MEEAKERKVRLPHKWEALLPILVLFVIMILNVILGWGADAHVPCLIAIIVAFIVGKVCGYTYSEILAGALSPLTRCLEAILIMLLIGVMIGSWLAAGTLPAMVYYGLRLITPGVFLPAAALISAVAAASMGSAWIATGTVGIAFMTMGAGMGFSAPLVAGMCISGAYTGDKLSPLSDTTRLAAVSAGTDLSGHIGAMVAGTVPSFVLALVLYLGVGLKAGENYDASVTDQLRQDILTQYPIIHLVLLLPLVVIVGACLARIPPLAGILLSSVVALTLAVMLQGAGFGDLITFAHHGYGGSIAEEFSADEETHALVLKLLNRGGMDSMYWTINLVMVAVSLGGVLQRIGAVEALMGGLVYRVREPWQAVLLVMGTSLFCNWTMCDRDPAIIVPGQMYQDKYDELGLSRNMLSRSLEDMGLMGAPLCPWNACGAYQAGVLGISPMQYIPYAFMSLIDPLFALVMAMLGRQLLFADGSRTTLLSGRIKAGGKRPKAPKRS